MAEPYITVKDMLRTVYTRQEFLIEEICGWALVVAGFLLAAGGDPGFGFLILLAGVAVSWHAHRRAFKHLVARGAPEE